MDIITPERIEKCKALIRQGFFFVTKTFSIIKKIKNCKQVVDFELDLVFGFVYSVLIDSIFEREKNMWHFRSQGISRVTDISGLNEHKSERYEGNFTYGGMMTFCGNTEYLVPMSSDRIGFALRAIAFSIPMWFWSNIVGLMVHNFVGYAMNFLSLYMILFGLYCLGPHRWVVANTKNPIEYQQSWYGFYRVYIWIERIAIVMYVIMVVVYIYQMIQSLIEAIKR